MAAFSKLLVIFVIILLVVWIGFVFLIVIFKNKTEQRKKNIYNFEDRYKDLADAIQRKKQEGKKNSGK